MLDYIVYFILKYTYLISGMVFLVKTYLFVRYKNRNWRFHEFFLRRASAEIAKPIATLPLFLAKDASYYT